MWRPDYATSAQLKAFMRVNDSVDDTQMSLAVTAASRAVDQACNRQFGQTAAVEARYYSARYDDDLCRWVVDVDDLGTLTGLLVAVDTDGSGAYADAVTALSARPLNALAVGDVYTALSVAPSSPVKFVAGDGRVRVTARWGWPAVPQVVVQATLLQASRLMARRDSPFGIAGSADIGSELRLMAKLDPDVALLLRTVYRWWGAV